MRTTLFCLLAAVSASIASGAQAVAASDRQGLIQLERDRDAASHRKAVGYGPQAAAGRTTSTTVRLFFVALDDRGKSGQKIGCDDSLVAVERRIPTTGTPLASAIAELVSIRDKNYGQSGLYNALVQSRLTVERVTLVAGLAEIRLAGAVSLGGACDAPRVDAQIRQTALQFPTVKNVAVFINGVPLERVLSSK